MGRVAHSFPVRPPFTGSHGGPKHRPAAPDPFAIAARRFVRSGAQLYLHDPVGFAKDCIVWPPARGEESSGLTTYQREILNKLVTTRRVAVRGPHGLGKTTTNALAILWFAVTREAARIDWKCVTTAGSWHQLEHYLWPEVHKWAARIDWGKLEQDPWRPDRELLSLNIKLRYGSAFAAASTRVELIEGAHADHLLFVFDESKAIKPDTFDAAEGALNGPGEAYALAQSTPGEPQGRFYDIHQQKPGYLDWWARHVTKHEVIAANRMDPTWAENRKLQWGFSSAVYQNRVEGAFFINDEDAVVPMSWVEAANERWVEWDKAGRPSNDGIDVFGVDVARGGNDLTAVAHRLGPVIQEIVTWNLADTTKVGVRLKRRMRRQTDLAVIDVIGVGAGVVDLMRRWRRNVVAFNAARRSSRRDRSGLFGFKNQRAAMWWMMREALDPAFDPVLAIPPDDDLLGELTAPKWRVIGDKIQVEKKEDVKSRIGRSTDLADAACHTLLTDAEFNQQELPDTPTAFGFTDSRDEDGGVFQWS
jgi:hypothetical protein